MTKEEFSTIWLCQKDETPSNVLMHTKWGSLNRQDPKALKSTQ
jgi:hypothetical protein